MTNPYDQMKNRLGGYSDLVAAMRLEHASLGDFLRDAASQLREWSHERVVAGAWPESQCTRLQSLASECEFRARHLLTNPPCIVEEYPSVGGMAADLGENVNDVGN